MSYLVVSPTYGRDYKSVKAVLADWTAGKDFRIESFGPDMGRAISIAEVNPAGLTVQVRYSRLTKSVFIRGGKVVS